MMDGEAADLWPQGPPGWIRWTPAKGGVLGGGRSRCPGDPDTYQVGLCVPCSTKEYSVTLGTAQLKPTNPRVAVSIQVKDIIVHPKFWGRTFTIGDVALLQLHTPVVFSKYVQPICLPEPTFDLKVGMQCWVTGWSQAKLRYSGEQEGVGGPTEAAAVPPGALPAGPPHRASQGTRGCDLQSLVLNVLRLVLTWALLPIAVGPQAQPIRSSESGSHPFAHSCVHLTNVKPLPRAEYMPCPQGAHPSEG